MQMENKLEYTDDLFVRTNKKYKEEVSVARHSVWVWWQILQMKLL